MHLSDSSVCLWRWQSGCIHLHSTWNDKSECSYMYILHCIGIGHVFVTFAALLLAIEITRTIPSLMSHLFVCNWHTIRSFVDAISNVGHKHSHTENNRMLDVVRMCEPCEQTNKHTQSCHESYQYWCRRVDLNCICARTCVCECGNECASMVEMYRCGLSVYYEFVHECVIYGLALAIIIISLPVCCVRVHCVHTRDVH